MTALTTEYVRFSVYRMTVSETKVRALRKRQEKHRKSQGTKRNRMQIIRVGRIED